MEGPRSMRERACIGAVLLSSSIEPIEYFACNEPIACTAEGKPDTNQNLNKGINEQLRDLADM